MKQTFLYGEIENRSSFVKFALFINTSSFFNHTSRKHMINKIFIFVSLLFLSAVSVAQNNCGNPVTICPNQNFQFAPAGPAGLPPGLNVSNPITPPAAPSGPNLGCQYNDAINPQWLILEVVSNGNLGFNLGGPGSTVAQNGQLHWTLYPYNATACADIFGNSLIPIACNYNCSSTGGTGFGPTIPGVPANPCNYLQQVYPVTSGQQFLLLVSNVNGTNTSVSFNNTGTAQLGCSPFTVPNATACPNQQTVVTASWPGYTVNNYTIAPQATPAATTVQASPNFSVASATTAVYNVTVSSGNNGFGQPSFATKSFTLTINPSATIAVAHATDYCYGANACVTISPLASSVSVSGPVSGAIYNIVNSPGSTVCLNNLQSPNANGVYSFTAQLTTGCIGTETIQLNVAPNSFITVPNSPMTLCQNANLNLTANMVTATSYTWNGPPCLVNYTNPNGTGNANVNSIQPNCSGVFTVAANINYNTIQCPRTNTVNVIVVPTYSIDVSPSQTVCQGATVSLVATASTTTIFSWVGPGGFTGNGSNVLVTNSATPIPHSGQYVVTAFFNTGLTSCQRTATTTINVVGVYPVAVLVPTTICQNAPAMMFMTAAGPPSSYLWSGPNNFTSTAQGPTIPNIQLNGTGTYTGMATWTSGTVSCNGFGYNNITVVPVNSITTNPSPPVCQPGNVNLLASAVGATSYSWNGPNGFSASTPNPILYYPPVSATGIYSVYVTFNSGGIICGNSATVDVSVNPILTYSLPGIVTACVGESVSIGGPVGGTSYTWSSSSGLAIDLPNNRDLMFSSIKEPHRGIYTLNAALGPCITTRQVQLDVISAISFSNAPSGYTACKGETKQLSVGVQGGSENYTIEWYPNTFFEGSPTGSVVTITPMGTTVYNIKVKDMACYTHTISHSFVVQINTAPKPSLELDKYEGCAPLCIKLMPNVQKGSAILTYDFGGIRKLQVTDSITEYCGLNEPGIYSMKVTSKNTDPTKPCSEEFTSPVQITVFPNANSEVTWLPEVPTTNDNVVTFSTYSKDNAKVAKTEWSFGGTGINILADSAVANPQVQYPEVGKYPVMLISTTDEGCIDTVFKILQISDELNVFIPNTFTPNNDEVNDIFMVKGLGFKPEGFTMEIFDRWGHLVYMTREVAKGWDGTVKGATPVEGVYIYRIRAIGANGEGRKEFTGHVTLIR